MAKVILICGMLCAGKSTYAATLPGVKLSSDVLTRALREVADHDVVYPPVKQYLFELSLEILREGVDIVLDWGFWTREMRQEAREFYRAHGVATEMHYLPVDEATLARHIAARNREVADGRMDVYAIDEGLLEKCRRMFEVPDDTEIDKKV